MNKSVAAGAFVGGILIRSAAKLTDNFEDSVALLDRLRNLQPD